MPWGRTGRHYHDHEMSELQKAAERARQEGYATLICQANYFLNAEPENDLGAAHVFVQGDLRVNLVVGFKFLTDDPLANIQLFRCSGTGEQRRIAIGIVREILTIAQSDRELRLGHFSSKEVPHAYRAKILRQAIAYLSWAHDHNAPDVLPPGIPDNPVSDAIIDEIADTIIERRKQRGEE